MPLGSVSSLNIVQNARITEYLTSCSVHERCDKGLIELTCPHFVIRGTMGGDRHIGQLEYPDRAQELLSSPDGRAIMT